MKTKIRTFIGMVALGVIGLANINATTGNKREVNTNVVIGKVESLKTDAEVFGTIYRTIKSDNETMESEKEPAVEKGMSAESNFLNYAHSYTLLGADREIEKYSNKQVALEEIRNGK